MMPLYQEQWYTFRFADDRIIPRFHLEGVEAGRRVKVFKIDLAGVHWQQCKAGVEFLPGVRRRFFVLLP